MYYIIYGVSVPSLLIESTDSMIIIILNFYDIVHYVVVSHYTTTLQLRQHLKSQLEYAWTVRLY